MSDKKDKKETVTGKYVYDKKLKKVVKVSDEITGLKKSGGNNSCLAGNNTCGGCCGA